LGGLAAAAAHELGSPLATIAITARELADALPEDSPFGEDVQELVTQSRRCRDILRWLSEQPEPDQHDAFIRMPLSRLLEGIARPHQDGGTEIEIRVEVEDGAQEPVLNPLPTVRHGLGNLIQNAVQFARRRVRIRVLVSVDQVRVVIEDDGPGFAPEVMEQLGEPYVSTRRDEGGLGLGVFIAQTLLARSGASLRFETRRGGATVEVNWPRDRLEHYLAEEPR
ncbi:MAG: ATP-binding protein, partial [Geminicoccaceae bacterium]|nr:ATP-binding protein [Geminicoccaceae bacterium]